MIPMANSPVRLPPCPIHLYLFRVTDQPPQEIVRNVVSACKYPPHGIRGFGPMFTHATGAIGGDYKAEADQQLVISVQIEHPNAVKEIDAILAEGVDVAFVSISLLGRICIGRLKNIAQIGPFDLSVSMGVQFGSQEHEDAIAKVLAACKKAKTTSAIFCTSRFPHYSYLYSFPTRLLPALYLSRCAATSPQPD